MTSHRRRIESPIGPLGIVVDHRSKLTRIDFLDAKRADPDPQRGLSDGHDTSSVERQLAEYFAGERRDFELELSPTGTPFQLAVWQLLRRIPYGETRSYGDLARELRRPRAARAVGRAVGTNPIPIVIPCHRVVGSDGSLTGFGGGLAAKAGLLLLEGNDRQASLA